MRPFLVCIHDATPAYARETGVMLRDLAPLLGRRFCLGVVPNWYGEWPLSVHRRYCRLVQESCEELLLHGYFHQRRHGWGPVSLLTGGCDEMNGLDDAETVRTLERGQRVFADVFGEQARGFVAPAWQQGRVQPGRENKLGLEYVLGYFSLASTRRQKLSLATWTWDCGRWGWLGHIGHGVGRLSHSLARGIPTLAIHPRDLQRGYWPKILLLVRKLLAAGYEPGTPARLLEANDVAARA